MLGRKAGFLVAAFLLALNTGYAAGETLPQPDGRAVLTVSGAVANTNRAAAVYDQVQRTRVFEESFRNTSWLITQCDASSSFSRTTCPTMCTASNPSATTT